MVHGEHAGMAHTVDGANRCYSNYEPRCTRRLLLHKRSRPRSSRIPDRDSAVLDEPVYCSTTSCRGLLKRSGCNLTAIIRRFNGDQISDGWADDICAK